jgi:hypothetical protein
MPNPVFPGSPNVYVPNHEASNKLVVDYSRNPKKFALNQYAQIVPVEQVLGLYQQMTIEERGRVMSTNAAEYDWDDAADAPSGTDGTESFIWQQYLAKRKAYAFRLGDMTVDQASWEILAQHADIHAQKAMTVRTQLAYNELTTSGNYTSGHVSAVFGGTISGTAGNWAQSTTARSDIKRSLIAAYEKILDNTLAAIEPDDMYLVMGSATAGQISESQEIIDAVKQSRDAWPMLQGNLPNGTSLYNIPSKLYGFNVVIDKTRKTTTLKGASTVTRTGIFAQSNAFLVARPGGLVAPAGGPAFSFLQQFTYKKYDMLVESKYDDDNKRTNGRVIDCVAMKAVAPSAGFWFQSVA